MTWVIEDQARTLMHAVTMSNGTTAVMDLLTTNAVSSRSVDGIGGLRAGLESVSQLGPESRDYISSS